LTLLQGMSRVRAAAHVLGSQRRLLPSLSVGLDALRVPQTGRAVSKRSSRSRVRSCPGMEWIRARLNRVRTRSAAPAHRSAAGSRRVRLWRRRSPGSRRRQPGHASIDVGSDQLAAGGFGLRTAVSNDTRTAAAAPGAAFTQESFAAMARRLDAPVGSLKTVPCARAVNSVNGALGKG
jgi:hypothetical protein